MLALGRILMFAACVPLLQPTGFCVCEAGHRGEDPVRHGNVAANEPHQTKKSTCECCAQRERHSRDDDRHSTSSDDCSTARQSSPHGCPSNDHHLPTCPASLHNRIGWINPAESHAPTRPLLQVLAFVPIEVVDFLSPSLNTSPNWHLSPPIYLSHCTLLI